MASTEDDLAGLDLLIRGFQVSRLLRLVADLDLADKLAEGASRNIAELAIDCGVQAQPLLRILRALASLDVFSVTAEGDVGHTPRSLLLRTNAPKSLYHAARFWTGHGSWKAWGELDVALTGGVPHQAAWQTSRFAYLKDHPTEARIFDEFMARMPDNRHQAISEAYDFSGARMITDVGGGNGECLRHILGRFPQPRGVVFDRDDVVEAIPANARLSGRISVAGGSFLEKVPEGSDIYLLVRVLHDWSDEDCLTILKNCRAAMPAQARLLIAEHLLETDPKRGRVMGYLIDIQMMAMFGSARERTKDELDKLLSASGFSLLRQISTSSVISVIEAAPR
jgi:hypothetical protein